MNLDRRDLIFFAVLLVATPVVGPVAVLIVGIALLALALFIGAACVFFALACAALDCWRSLFSEPQDPKTKTSNP